jgi:hypothetical protein
MAGVLGQPLPWWAPELKPCGTLAAYRRHQRRGEKSCKTCRQAVARDWRDRRAAGKISTRQPRHIIQARQ